MRNWSLNGPEQDWFTKKELALYLDISTKALDRLISQGEFPRGIRSTPRTPLRWSGLDVAVWLYLRSRSWKGLPDTGPEDVDEDASQAPS